MIAFCVAILSFIWRTGSENDTSNPLTARQALGPRVAISAVFAFGLFNFCMILCTFGTYSHIAVRRDRRSRFGRRPNVEDGIGRGRQPANKRAGTAGVSDEEREKDKVGVGVTERGKFASDSMIGLGLTGLGGDHTGLRQGSPASAAAIREDVDLEKGDRAYLGGSAKPAFSPKLSPKL